MLYQRWRDIARARAEEWALWDLSSDRRWTFRELAAAAESVPRAETAVHFPQGSTVDFVLTVLTAWRCRRICCPLEAGHSVPRDAFAEPERWPKDIAHLKITSATTGLPRLVTFTSAQLMADVENIGQSMGLRPEWPNLGVISLAHSYGFSNLVLPLLLQGIPLLLLDSPLPEAVRSAATLVPHITLAGVPALWRAWYEARAIPTNIQLAISAGAPLPLVLEQSVFAGTGLKIHNFYGATECGGIAYDGSETPRLDSAGVGNAMNNVQLSADDEGCLEVRSAAVGQGYWPDAQPNLANGCYRTSDLVELKDGLVFLRGRASDQINVAGRKVSPEAIERSLLAHPAVADCLVFGVPSREAERGEFIVACIVPRKTVTEEPLKQFLLSQLPAWQVPREWKFLESLAPNQRGKLSRAEWRAKLGYGVG